MITEGMTGFVIPIGDVAAGMGALEKLLSSPSLRQVMGQAAQVRVQEVFSLAAFQQKLTTHLWQQLKRN